MSHWPGDRWLGAKGKVKQGLEELVSIRKIKGKKER